MTLLDELKVPLAAVLPTRSWAKSAVVALRVLAAATVTFRFRLMPPSAKEVLPADRDQGVLDLQVARCALQLGRRHEARGREAVDGEVRRGVHARGVLQVRDPLAQGVEVGDEGVAGVALTFAPTIAGYLQGRVVAQDGLGGEGRLAQQVPDDFRGELGLDQVEDPASLGAGGHGEVAGVEGPEVVGPHEAAVRLGLGPGVASDAQGGLVAQNRVADQRRLQKQIAHDAGRELLLHQVENLPRLRAGSSDQVAGVPRRLVQEGRPVLG